VIDVDAYQEIRDLFRFRYDPPVLGIIAERPHRFRELVNRLESHVDGHVDDNTVGRSLDRLERVRHVVRTQTRVGRRSVPIYTITDEGTRYVRVYDAFVDAYRTANSQDGGARPDNDEA
jgi:DNA-binding PadR family transcriptional regulator